MRLALEHREPPADDGASSLWRSRTRGRQLVIAVDHDDYPALVAEALDQLAAAGWTTAPAAERLGVTGSQLHGLFRRSAAAWAALNRLRTEAGLRPLV